MEFEPVYYAYLLLCVVVFIDVLFTFRKNSLLKACFLLIISSLFVMNYFSYPNVENRLQFVIIKSMRVVYVCSAMLAIIHLVTPRIPRWIITLVICSFLFTTGFRIFYFNQIDIEGQLSNQVFAVGAEFHSPHPVARYTIMSLAVIAVAITFHYYRRFLMRMNTGTIYYKPLRRWIISIVLPFFLLIISGILGNLDILQKSISSYLFSLFSLVIIFSILLRPRFLNATSYLDASCGQTGSTLQRANFRRQPQAALQIPSAE